jgi:hypothetical protein
VWLFDVVERHKAYPRTFLIPSPVERESLRPGDMAKLLFAGFERMWVEVKICKDGRYVGILANRPVMAWLSKVEQGDRIEFGPEHVADIRKGQA